MARRALGLYRHLPACGWEPWVVTADPARIWNPFPHWPADRSGYDPSRVVRTDFALPWHWLSRAGYRGLRAIGRKRMAELFRFPDAELAWLPHAVAASLKLAREHPLDAIVSTAPPPTAHLAARAVRWRLREHPPWVADYRDFWSGLVTGVICQPPLGLDARLERLVLNGASGITTISPDLAHGLGQKHPGLPVEIVHNGYDPQDFADLPDTPRSDKLIITHAGTNYPGFQDPLPLLRALAELVRTRAMDPARIELRIIGWLFEIEALRREVAALGLGDVVRIEPRVPRHELLPRLAESAVHWAMGFAGGRQAGTIPAKVFEAFGCGRFVLATGVLPGEDLHILLEQTGAGMAISNDPQAITVALRELYQRFEDHGAGAFVLDAKQTAAYTHQSMAKRFAGFLDDL